MHHVRFIAAALVVCGLASVVATAASATLASSTSAAAPGEVRLRAKLSGNTLASGGADWRTKVVTKFKAQIEDAVPNTSYDIQLNGVTIGKFTTDGFGNAEKQWESGAPMMKAGDVITIGPVSGTLSTK
jgi:hypothetical protein